METLEVGSSVRDPHVEWLKYDLKCTPPGYFDDPPPIQTETSAFCLTVSEGVAQFEFKEHHATVDSAREFLAPFLRAWEISSGLAIGAGLIRFEFREARRIDREPPAPGEIGAYGASTLGDVTMSALCTVRLPMSKYPDLPDAFEVTPDVETMWNRYEGYVRGREPLPAMAYFCLTVVESCARARTQKRERAAQKLAIDLGVLEKLGRLTSTKGDLLTARKAADNLVPHTPEEVTWMEAALKAIIRQMAASGTGRELKQLRMSDLPALSNDRRASG